MQLESFNHHLIRLPRIGKRLLALALDTVLCVITVWLAWCLRLDQWVPYNPLLGLESVAACVLGLPVFWYFGLYATIFRYAGWNAMLALVRATTVYGFLFALIFTLISVPGIPRSTGIIQPLLMFVALGTSRVLIRLWLGDLYRGILQKAHAPGVLVYGAGAAGRQLAGSLLRMNDQRLVGFVDDDRSLQNRQLDGIPVFAPGRLAEVVSEHGVRDVLLAMPSIGRTRRREIIDSLQPYPVHVRTLPGLDELVSHGIGPQHLQEIEIEDLLGREPVAPERALMGRHLSGRTVLVTGAGGSIGSELCRQILQWTPHTLLMLDSSEYALYEILQELRPAARQGGTKVIALPGSVLDGLRVDEIMATWHPDIVYHAAAYKHVPLVERNPVQGLRNNIWGTLTCAQAAARHGVGRFVLISTDKAVRPTNVMGASKRIAEMVLQAFAASKSGATCFTMVRFGNVLGSSGSVVPLFRQQIAAGGPVTLTHRDITRFFMTIPEAAQLVIQAGAMAQGGDVFVLDMGEPVRIHDLARRMIELTGRHVRDEERPWGDIEIRITGLRPGEKLYEELLIGENTHPTEHPRIRVAQESMLPWQQLEQELQRLDSCMRERNLVAVRDALTRLVEGYQPPPELMDWVQQARTTVLQDVGIGPRPGAPGPSAQ